MNNRIKGVFPIKEQLGLVDIFGYTTKGIPGLEILGMGQSGRIVKEKFIYLARKLGGPYTMRRYVLCVEADQRLGNYEKEWLEFPLLVLFWNLRGTLSIKNLEEYYASGKVSVGGMIAHLDLGQEFIEIQRMRGLHYVSPPNITGSNCQSAESLMRGISNFS